MRRKPLTLIEESLLCRTVEPPTGTLAASEPEISAIHELLRRRLIINRHGWLVATALGRRYVADM